MNFKKLAIAAVLVDLAALTAWGFYSTSFSAFLELLQEPWMLQTLLDLTIGLTIASVWMWRDARSRGVSPIPFIVLTVCTGSFGPLIYLLVRPQSQERTDSTKALSRLDAVPSKVG